MFIRHTSFIRFNTFPKKWAVPYDRISMSNWSTYSYKFVWINLHLLYRPRHPCLLFGTIHEASGDPCLIFRTPLLIGTQEYWWCDAICRGYCFSSYAISYGHFHAQILISTAVARKAVAQTHFGVRSWNYTYGSCDWDSIWKWSLVEVNGIFYTFNFVM